MMTRTGTKAVAALSIFLAACSGGSSGGGSGASGAGGSSMFVQSCTLGCSNGLGGNQVTCQILNTFENADLSITFSQPVDLSTATSTTFRIININNGQTPNGTYLLDPNDSRRLIFRPQLIFDVDGNPQLGFEQGETYQVLIPGLSQNDVPPFIESTSGKPNQSRLVCQITTDGIADTVPGRPTFDVFVENQAGQMISADSATDVPGSSPVVVVFNDLMKLGSLLVPTDPFAPSPSISFRIDPDGNLADPSDQVALAGQLSFQVDFAALKTTITFVPSGGLPSGGAGTPKRKVVVDVSTAAIDLADNPVLPQPTVSFEPEEIIFAPTTIAESFTDTSKQQAEASGANMWAQDVMVGGMALKTVVPGAGGGSGRLGELRVGTNETRTLYTGPIAATASIGFLGNPCDQETFRVDTVDYAFCDDLMNCPPGFVGVQIASDSLPAMNAANDEVHKTANNFVDALNANSPSNVSFEARTPTSGAAIIEVIARANVPGSAGNAIELGGIGGLPTSDTSMCAGAPTPVVASSGLFLEGGIDGESFAPGSLIDNTDFSMMGAMPGPIDVNDGVFEFSRVRVDATGRLVFRGPNPARVFSRGRMTIDAAAIVDLSGSTPALHIGRSTDGEPGGEGGPNGGRGGAGGDREDSSGTPLVSVTPPLGGVRNPGADIDGRPGEGVARMGNVAAGQGGPGWPDVMPTDISTFGTMDALIFLCTCHQVPGPGGGGGYAVDGQPGTPQLPVIGGMVETAGSNGVLNAPDLNPMDGVADNTPGGDSTQSGIEAPTAPLDVRALDPDQGDLRGGSGGGGGGGHAYGSFITQFLNFNTCADPQNQLSVFVPTSGGGGGGGGGAGQFQAGETLDVSGFIDASGGDGGDGFVDLGDPEGARFQSSGGGGGSGGAILAQANTVNITPGAARMSVEGGAPGDGIQMGTGGAGGAGLIRVEDLSGGVSASAIAPLILPNPDPVDPVMFPNSESVLSVGPSGFSPDPTIQPGAFSGVQSCWLTAPGNFFGLTFEPDDPMMGTFGWSLDLVVDVTGTPTLVSYRDPANNGGFAQLMGMSWQDFLGEQIDDGVVASPSPFVVRFQGAKRSQQISNFCNVSVTTQTSGVTPWVRHPAELNTFSPRPDMIRFVIIFDSSHPLAGQILGARNMAIQAIPD